VCRYLYFPHLNDNKTLILKSKEDEMFSDDLYMQQQRLELLLSRAHIARRRWSEHVLPMVERTYESFKAQHPSLDHPPMTVDSREVGDPKHPQWGDCIRFCVGSRPAATALGNQPAGSFHLLPEVGTNLDLFQTVSGEVLAVITPPISAVVQPDPEQKNFIVGSWPNPMHIWSSDFRMLLLLMHEVDMFCRTNLFPNPDGLRVHGKLLALNDIHANGKSWLVVWLRRNLVTILRMLGLIKGDMSALKSLLRAP